MNPQIRMFLPSRNNLRDKIVGTNGHLYNSKKCLKVVRNLDIGCIYS